MLNGAHPDIRKPGSAWIELLRPRSAAAATGRARPDRLRPRLHRPSVSGHADRLPDAAMGVSKIFSEKISTRAAARPDWTPRSSSPATSVASGVAVTLVVHEHKRLGRGIDLATLAEQLRASDIGLEFLDRGTPGLARPLRCGVHCAGCAVRDGARVHPRPSLEGHESARKARKEHRRRQRHRRRLCSPWPCTCAAGAQLARHRRQARDHHPARRRASTLAGYCDAHAARARRPGWRGERHFCGKSPPTSVITAL